MVIILSRFYSPFPTRGPRGSINSFLSVIVEVQTNRVTAQEGQKFGTFSKRWANLSTRRVQIMHVEQNNLTPGNCPIPPRLTNERRNTELDVPRDIHRENS